MCLSSFSICFPVFSFCLSSSDCETGGRGRSAPGYQAALSADQRGTNRSSLLLRVDLAFSNDTPSSTPTKSPAPKGLLLPYHLSWCYRYRSQYFPAGTHTHIHPSELTEGSSKPGDILALLFFSLNFSFSRRRFDG